MKYRKFIILFCLLTQVKATAQVAIFCSHKKFEPTISVTLSNCTSQPIKLWQQDCSWGWANFSVEFGSGTNHFLVKRKLIDWTVNAPGFYSISPRGTNVILLNLNDRYWKFPAGFSITNDSPIRVIYSVEKTIESRSHGVLTGEFSSNCECGR